MKRIKLKKIIVAICVLFFIFPLFPTFLCAGTEQPVVYDFMNRIDAVIIRSSRFFELEDGLQIPYVFVSSRDGSDIMPVRIEKPDVQARSK